MFSKFIRTHPELFEHAKGRVRNALPISADTRIGVTATLNKVHAKYFQDFVFIHIPKCGGTSVERALGLPLLNHDAALERYRFLGERRWRERLTFAVVRNPYARLASSYFYLHRTTKTALPDLQEEFRFWLFRWQSLRDEGVLPKALRSQRWWLSDENGEQLVKEVCKLEQIDDDIKPIAARLDREINVQHLNIAPQQIDYDDLYTPATRDMVKDLYEEDFERFAYAM